MTRKTITILVILLLLVGIITAILLLQQPKADENELYKKQFGDTILRFERYDYALGQNMIVGVEKSTNKGKKYTRVTENPITVSLEAKFLLLNETLAFVVSTDDLSRRNQFKGFLVSADGGQTFSNAEFHYDNANVDILTLDDFPYVDGNTLKMKCSVYDINVTRDGYEEMELIFLSYDNGFTWTLE